jgi:hypothetical protein
MNKEYSYFLVFYDMQVLFAFRTNKVHTIADIAYHFSGPGWDILHYYYFEKKHKINHKSLKEITKEEFETYKEFKVLPTQLSHKLTTKKITKLIMNNKDICYESKVKMVEYIASRLDSAISYIEVINDE